MTSNNSNIEYIWENFAKNDVENQTEDLTFDGANNKKLNEREKDEDAGADADVTDNRQKGAVHLEEETALEPI